MPIRALVWTLFGGVASHTECFHIPEQLVANKEASSTSEARSRDVTFAFGETRYFWKAGLSPQESCFPWLVKVTQAESNNRLEKPAFHSPVPLLFLIGTLMRALGVDPLPGGWFMPRLSHSPCKTKITRQAEFHCLVIQQPTMMD